jgi:TonB-dependent SusC/RagA subfamily outer membrane receptor
VVLIAIFLLSGLIPFIELTLIKESRISELSLNLDSIIAMAGNVPADEAALGGSERVIYLPFIALIVYITGVVVTSGFSILSFVRMSALLTNKDSQRKSIGGGVTLIIHKESASPFSWMSYIAISEKDYNENAREILSHEMAHIKGLHSADIIIAELMRILHWFNPAVWLLKQEIRNIHEFQADEAVINSGIDAKQYQLLLIKKAVGDRLYTMANSFNHSKLKNRITMITKKKSTRSASLKAMFVLPLTLFAVILFADEKVTSALEPVSNAKITDLIQKDTTKEVSKSVKIILNGDKAASAKGDIADSTKKVKVRMVLNGKDTSTMVYSIALKDSLKPSVIVIDNKIINAENTNEVKVVKGEMTVLWDATADDKNPLIVVNGEIQKPTFDIPNLSSESIKSITILKDKSALSLYGTKGKNGVIVITLKDGAQNIDGKTEENGNKEERREFRVIGINQIDKNSPDSVKSEIRIKSSGNVQNPLYVIDGKVIKEGGDINAIKAENIESINIFKDKTAIEKYGERAKNGVIEITLKKGVLSNDGKAVKPVEAVKPVKGVKPVAADNHKAQERSAGVAKSRGIINPIYVVDGEIMKKGFDIANITPERIASMTILKDKSAIDKYGEKGKNGVIEITLKK